MSDDAAEVALRARDGFVLGATTYGDRRTARAAVLLVGAMGVPQRFYARFSRWLAMRGYWVVTFDYRGMGRSRPARFAHSLRGFDAAVSTSAAVDVAGAVDFVAAEGGPRPLLWVGHSLGGQLLGLVPNRERVTALHELYGAAWQEHKRVSPLEAGAARIGHFGFFDRRFESSLWPRAEAWLARNAGRQSSFSIADANSRESGDTVLPK